MYHLIDYVWCVEKFSSYLDRHETATTTTTAVATATESLSGDNHHHNQQQQQQQQQAQQHNVYPLLTSPVFTYKNTRWVLNLYPEGLGDASSAGYVSLFIKYVSEEPESICAKVELALFNNKNDRVYLRDTGDHVYQTFIDFGYKQFVKLCELREQRNELLTAQGSLKVFARVEFEMAGTLPASVTWANYDLLLFKEQFKTLYESKHLCDILVRVVRRNKQRLRPQQQQQQQQQQRQLQRRRRRQQQQHSHSHRHHYSFHPVIIDSDGSNSSSNGNSFVSSVPRMLNHNHHNHHHHHHHHQHEPKSKRMKICDNQTYEIVENTSVHHHHHHVLAAHPCSTCHMEDSSFSSSSACNYASTNHTSHNHHLERDTPYDDDEDDDDDNDEYDDIDDYDEYDGEMMSGNVRTGDDDNAAAAADETFDIKAHKFILASRSGKFRELLKTNLIKMNNSFSTPPQPQPLTTDAARTPSQKLSNYAKSPFSPLPPQCSCVCTCDYYYDDDDDDDNDSDEEDAYDDEHCLHSSSVASSSASSCCSSSSSSSSTDKNNGNEVEYDGEECENSEAVLCHHTNYTQQQNNHLGMAASTIESATESSTSSSSATTSSLSSSSSSNPSSFYDSHDNDESDNPISDLLIIETDRSPKVIEYLIRYMYTGYLDSLDAYARDIYEISKEFKVHGLTALAREHLAKELSVANCCDLLIFGVCQNDYELNTRVHAFIEANYSSVMRTHAYKQARRKYRELIENTFGEIARKISPPSSLPQPMVVAATTSMPATAAAVSGAVVATSSSYQTNICSSSSNGGASSSSSNGRLTTTLFSSSSQVQQHHP